MPCGCQRRRGWKPPPASKPLVIGEEGFFLMRYLGAELNEPLQGDITGALYMFHERRELYVDKRDAVYLMGPEFEVM